MILVLVFVLVALAAGLGSTLVRSSVPRQDGALFPVAHRIRSRTWGESPGRHRSQR